METLTIAAFVIAGAAVIYFLFLAATKGLPAAWAWVKAKWNAGKADLAALEADVVGANSKISALISGDIASIKTRLSVLEAKTGLPIGAPAAAAPAAAGQASPAPAAQ